MSDPTDEAWRQFLIDEAFWSELLDDAEFWRSRDTLSDEAWGEEFLSRVRAAGIHDTQATHLRRAEQLGMLRAVVQNVGCARAKAMLKAHSH